MIAQGKFLESLNPTVAQRRSRERPTDTYPSFCPCSEAQMARLFRQPQLFHLSLPQLPHCMCWLPNGVAFAALLLMVLWTAQVDAGTSRGVKVTDIDGKSPAEFVAGRSGKS